MGRYAAVDGGVAFQMGLQCGRSGAAAAAEERLQFHSGVVTDRR